MSPYAGEAQIRVKRFTRRTHYPSPELAELLKHQPSASLAAFRQRAFRHKWMQELYLEGLHKTGLRDE
jgi:hypothetical protein